MHGLGGMESGRQDQPLVKFRIPRQARHRRYGETLDKQPALVVHARIVGAAHRSAAPGFQKLPGPRKQGRRGFFVVLALKEAKKSDLIAVTGVVGSIDDGGNPADRAPVPPGDERMNLAVRPAKGGFRREIFGDATGKRWNEGRNRSVQVLRDPLELRPLPRHLAI